MGAGALRVRVRAACRARRALRLPACARALLDHGEPPGVEVARRLGGAVRRAGTPRRGSGVRRGGVQPRSGWSWAENLRAFIWPRSVSNPRTPWCASSRTELRALLRDMVSGHLPARPAVGIAEGAAGSAALHRGSEARTPRARRSRHRSRTSSCAGGWLPHRLRRPHRRRRPRRRRSLFEPAAYARSAARIPSVDWRAWTTTPPTTSAAV